MFKQWTEPAMESTQGRRGGGRMCYCKFRSIKWIAATAFRRVFSSVNLVKKNICTYVYECEKENTTTTVTVTMTMMKIAAAVIHKFSPIDHTQFVKVLIKYHWVINECKMCRLDCFWFAKLCWIFSQKTVYCNTYTQTDKH